MTTGQPPSFTILVLCNPCPSQFPSFAIPVLWNSLYILHRWRTLAVHIKGWWLSSCHSSNFPVYNSHFVNFPLCQLVAGTLGSISKSYQYHFQPRQDIFEVGIFLIGKPCVVLHTAECCISLRNLICPTPVNVQSELIHQGLSVGDVE